MQLHPVEALACVSNIFLWLLLCSPEFTVGVLLGKKTLATVFGCAPTLCAGVVLLSSSCPAVVLLAVLQAWPGAVGLSAPPCEGFVEASSLLSCFSGCRPFYHRLV